MEQKNTNKIPSEKDLSNSFPQGLKNIITAKGGHEKWVLILLVAIVVVGVPLSIWQINNQLKSPFKRKEIKNSEKIDSVARGDNTQTSQSNNLSELDTDNDGLSDYDELYRYKTSPYIADSDSDKIADKLEVDQGTDPNCPEGQTCGRVDITDIGLDQSNTSGTDQGNLDNLSVEQLRQLMINAGAPADEVNKISDNDLLDTYKKILAEEGINTNSTIGTINSNKEFSLETIDYETLLNLQPTEIRQLLIEGGVPKETLDQVDDEMLKEIYMESLGQNFKELSQQ